MNIMYLGLLILLTVLITFPATVTLGRISCILDIRRVDGRLQTTAGFPAAG